MVSGISLNVAELKSLNQFGQGIAMRRSICDSTDRSSILYDEKFLLFRFFLFSAHLYRESLFKSYQGSEKSFHKEYFTFPAYERE